MDGDDELDAGLEFRDDSKAELVKDSLPELKKLPPPLKKTAAVLLLFRVLWLGESDGE